MQKVAPLDKPVCVTVQETEKSLLSRRTNSPSVKKGITEQPRMRSTEVWFNSVSRNFRCLSKLPWLLGSGKVSGKPQTNSLSHGISALPLLVLAKPRKCRGVLKSKILGKNTIRTFFHQLAKSHLVTCEFGAQICNIWGSFIHPYRKCDKFTILQKPQKSRREMFCCGLVGWFFFFQRRARLGKGGTEHNWRL